MGEELGTGGSRIGLGLIAAMGLLDDVAAPGASSTWGGSGCLSAVVALSGGAVP